MNISIQSVNFKAGNTLEYFIREKVSGSGINYFYL